MTNFTANALLALGAAPAMVDVPIEAGQFARIASGVLINLGTPHAEQRTAMLEAAHAAHDAGTPWVLDPVAVGTLTVRTDLARELLALAPTAIRGNASEIIGLAGQGSGGRGVDATDLPETALAAATHLAEATGAVIAISGAVDLITDGTETIRVANGHPLLTQVTGGGCALGAVTAAFLSLTHESAASGGHAPSPRGGLDVLAATAAATAVYTIAAELAAADAEGPGSFGWRFIDRLHDLDAATVAARVRLS
ncbi:hydroxyethylthiazole kinase [Leucobacter exalbidus]|uniref:Hydroxyethylthiazole kinase n=1 Tax=Leucobacter exalbidus TaxID=662960 RepID=A0A940PVL6_9MICO|nr:hydroxyethylthiazole kinase [Leucobacter exalbidus]